MTLHRQANHNSHYFCTPALWRVAADHTRRLSAHNVSKGAHCAIGIVSQLHPQNGDHAACGYRDHSQNETAARRCGCALQVRSTVALRGGRVQSWELFRISGARRQIGGLQISAAKISASIAVENSSAPSPSTLTRAARPSRSANSPNAPTVHTDTGSAPSTIGSMDGRRRPCPSRCGSSGRSIPNDRRAAA